MWFRTIKQPRSTPYTEALQGVTCVHTHITCAWNCACMIHPPAWSPADLSVLGACVSCCACALAITACRLFWAAALAPLGAQHALGDERHMIFECPALQ